MPQNSFFFLRTWDLVSQKMTQRHFFPTLHPLSTVIFATATVLAFSLLRNSMFNLHCYTQREATPTQKSAWKCAATSCNFLRERSQSAFTLANQLCQIAHKAIVSTSNWGPCTTWRKTPVVPWFNGKGLKSPRCANHTETLKPFKHALFRAFLLTTVETTEVSFHRHPQTCTSSTFAQSTAHAATVDYISYSSSFTAKPRQDIPCSCCGKTKSKLQQVKSTTGTSQPVQIGEKKRATCPQPCTKCYGCTGISRW